ncbi:MAG: FecR family protein, partial [Flavitalea sp.]
NRQYLEELQRTLDIIHIGQLANDVNVNEEWTRFQQIRLEKEQRAAFGTSAEAFGNVVLREVNFKRKTSIYRSIAVIAVAASVILAIGLGWSLLATRTQQQNTLVTVEKTNLHLHKPEYRFLANKGKENLVYNLQDGTEVLLAPNSTLSFRQPFEANSRNLFLTGKAEFRVAHDKQKPFTVFSGTISTTAVGTRFAVTAFNNGSRITVTLFEGKVLVKDLAKTGRKSAYYLQPGQQLVHYKPKLKTTVVAIAYPVSRNGMADQPNEENTTDDNPLIPKYGKGSWYMFNNQPLTKVFDQLSDMYNVKIEYTDRELARMYFIGTFNREDSLMGVLQQIATLNKLEVLRTNNKYTIKRK